MIKKLCLIIGLSFLLYSCLSKDKSIIRPGEIWNDTGGNPINAHGGGILYVKGTYYWYGEYKKGPTWRVPYIDEWECYRTDAGGVSCYSSSDLTHWKSEEIVLTPEKKDSASDLHYSKVLERPKVIYNENTRKYVMWLHIDSEDYSYARAGVAISESPTGPFTYLGSVKPYGHMCRDMTLFKDENGKAYHIFASENNATLYISMLDSTYLKHSGNFIRVFVNQSREAPAMIKIGAKYFLVTSGCTGWAPNEAMYAVADSVLGSWRPVGNPCAGPGSDTTFGVQCSYILPVKGSNNQFIFMADRWNKTNLEDSRYVWLPFETNGDSVQITWSPQWKL